MTIYGNLQFILLKNDQQYPQSIVLQCMKCVMKCLKTVNSCDQCNSGLHQQKNIELQQEHSIKSSRNFFTEKNTSVPFRIIQFLQEEENENKTLSPMNGNQKSPSSIRLQQDPNTSIRSLLTPSNPNSLLSSPLGDSQQDDWHQSFESSKIDRLTKEIKVLEQEKKVYQQTIQTLQAENSQLTTQIENLQKSTAELSKIKRLEMEKLVLAQELERAKLLMEENKRNYYDSKLEAEKLKEQLDSTMFKLEKEIEQTTELSEEINKLRLKATKDAGEQFRIEQEKKSLLTKKIRDIEQQQIALLRRKEFISLMNQNIFSRKQTRSIHQGYCSLLCLALDFHNELWRDIDSSIMYNHLNLVYEQISKNIEAHNGYISHFSNNEEFIISFNSVYDNVEFTLQLLDDLMNIQTNKAFDHLKYTSTVVHSINKGLLLFRGVRYRTYIHTDYPKTKSNAVTVRDQISGLNTRVLHDVHYGDSISKLQFICRTQTIGGILAISPDAWQEISHLSLETSYTKSPIQTYVDESISTISPITYIYPKSHSERLTYAIGYNEKRIEYDIDQSLAEIDTELQNTKNDLQRIEEGDDYSNQDSSPQPMNSDSNTLWNKLKPELDSLVDLMVKQTREVSELESSTNNTPTKSNLLRELRIKLDQTRLRHQHIKDFMQSITSQQDLILRLETKNQEIERDLLQASEQLKLLDLRCREKDTIILQQSNEFQKLKLEIKNLIERIMFTHASGATNEEKNLLQRLEFYVKTGQANQAISNESPKTISSGISSARRRKSDPKIKIQLDKFKTKCDLLTEDLQNTETKLKQAISTIDRLNHTIDNLKSSKKTTLGKLEVSEKKVSFLEHQIRKKNEEIDNLKLRLETFSDREKKMNSESKRKNTSNNSFNNTPSLPQIARTSIEQLAFQKKLNNFFSHQNESQTVIYMENQTYGTILANTYWTSGEHRFTIQLDRATDNILIGVVDVLHPFEKRIGETDKSWGLSINTGSVFHAAGWKRFANRRIDSYVVIDLDLRRSNEGKGTISFIIDGLDFGIAAANLKGALCPAVTFFHRGDQVTIM